MKRYLVLLFMIAVMLTLGIQSAFAVDDQGNPNDPNSNDRANACYEDGSMASKCDTDWAWTCGWFLIRFEAQTLEREAIPDMCESLLPALPASQESSQSSSHSSSRKKNCVSIGSLYIDFGGSNFRGSPVQTYFDSDCSISYFPYPANYVYTSAGKAKADDICVSHLGSGFEADSIGADVYVCGPTST